jgi:hypothetical protein
VIDFIRKGEVRLMVIIWLVRLMDYYVRSRWGNRLNLQEDQSFGLVLWSCSSGGFPFTFLASRWLRIRPVARYSKGLVSIQAYSQFGTSSVYTPY